MPIEVKRPPEAIASQTEAKRARPAISRDNTKNLPDIIGRNERSIRMEKKLYCSSCRHSKYVLDEKKIKRLFCAQRKAFGQRALLDTDCTDAEVCLEYDPERMRDALTSRKNYREAMSRAGIAMEEEAEGVLSDERLE